jgi:hypothetical protein
LEKAVNNLTKMKYSILLLVIFFILNSSYGQGRSCPTTINLQTLQTQDPVRYQRFMELENFTQNFINQQSNFAGRLINPNGIIIIPVVVHILHRGESIGNGRNLSIAQIQSQIDVLNEDFRHLNPDRFNTPGLFAGLAADYGFEFRLACIDPNGNPTNGITRTYTNKRNFQFIPAGQFANENSMGIKSSNLSGKDPWPTNRYLNIWVCKFNDGILGYATFPADFATRPNFDGIVIDCEAFGRTGTVKVPFNRGKTATHEVGHWLNLRHIWGDQNCGNDLVNDTPPQDESNTGCPGFPQTSFCNGLATTEMTMNYMDYSDDDCVNLFTNGQRLRGRAVFAAGGGPRFAFIDNYFRIQPPSPLIRCNDIISLINPMCLPVTWSVVSGPATIVSSNNSQAEVKVNQNANGVVTLRAVSGNYISEATFNMSYEGPLSPAIGPFNYDANCGTFAESYCTRQASTDSYLWNLNFGQVVQDNPGYYGNYFYTAPLVNGPQQGFQYFQYLSVQGKNACGVSPASEIQFTVGPILSSCGSGGGGGPILRVSSGPNPTNSNLNISVNVQAMLQAGHNNPNWMQIKEIRIYDKLGNMKKRTLFPAGTQSISEFVGNLPNDMYNIHITNGTHTVIKPILIQH